MAACTLGLQQFEHQIKEKGVIGGHGQIDVTHVTEAVIVGKTTGFAAETKNRESTEM